MILTFAEIGVDVENYTGMIAKHAEALIINVACNYVMLAYYPHDKEEDIICIPFCSVSFVNGFVSIDTLKPVTIH